MPISPETVVHLCSKIPISPEHQRTFATENDQYTYFLNKASHTFQDFTYQREEVAVKVSAGYDALYDCNYLMYQNLNYSEKWFYAYITKKEYVNPNVTRVYFELDVFQTWQFDLTYHPSFIAREHTRRWNVDGSPVINTVDEGLDYGSEYDTVSVTNYRPNGGYKFLVTIMKNQIHIDTETGQPVTEKVNPVVIGTPQPLTYYVIPFKDNDEVPAVEVDGSYITFSPPTMFLKAVYEDTDAVNNIVSIFVTDSIGIPNTFEANVSGVGDVLHFPSGTDVQEVNVTNTTLAYAMKVGMIPSFSAQEDTIHADKYEGFNPVEESKLMMYPYCVTVLDDFKGNRIELKNEYINDPSLTLQVKGSMGTSNKTSVNVKNYNFSAADLQDEVANEYALINNDPSDVPILTDLLSAYLQGNKNSLMNQRQQMFTGAMQRFLHQSNSVLPNTKNVGGVVDFAIDSVYEPKKLQLQMEAINARKQDIDNTPPHLSNMGGNTSYGYGNGYNGVFIIKKQIKPEYRRKLEDYFHMFGYKLNELKVPDLTSRQHFNYVQTVGANIVGDVPGEDLEKIKQLFDNGITLWHGDYVYDYSLANGEA